MAALLPRDHALGQPLPRRTVSRCPPPRSGMRVRARRASARRAPMSSAARSQRVSARGGLHPEPYRSHCADQRHPIARGVRTRSATCGRASGAAQVQRNTVARVAFSTAKRSPPIDGARMACCRPGSCWPTGPLCPDTRRLAALPHLPLPDPDRPRTDLLAAFGGRVKWCSRAHRAATADSSLDARVLTQIWSSPTRPLTAISSTSPLRATTTRGSPGRRQPESFWSHDPAIASCASHLPAQPAPPTPNSTPPTRPH